MAIYRLSAQLISRGNGRSATAAAAYRSGGRIFDAKAGLLHDYERRHGVVHQEVMAPGQTPSWMLDREALWNAVESAEKRRDAQLCREVQLALPHELGRDQQLDLVRGFVGDEFVARGMIADFAIHDADRQGDRRNTHVHVMLTLREVNGDGFGNKERSWNDRTLLGRWRQQWESHVNQALERAGYVERVDHRTLLAQRLDAERQAVEARAANDNQRAETLELDAIALNRAPEPKIGQAAIALERQGHRTVRGDHWRAVVVANANRLRSWLVTQRERVEQAWQRLIDWRSDGFSGFEGTPKSDEAEAALRDLSGQSRRRQRSFKSTAILGRTSRSHRITPNSRRPK